MDMRSTPAAMSGSPEQRFDRLERDVHNGLSADHLLDRIRDDPAIMAPLVLDGGRSFSMGKQFMQRFKPVLIAHLRKLTPEESTELFNHIAQRPQTTALFHDVFMEESQPLFCLLRAGRRADSLLHVARQHLKTPDDAASFISDTRAPYTHNAALRVAKVLAPHFAADPDRITAACVASNDSAWSNVLVTLQGCHDEPQDIPLRPTANSLAKWALIFEREPQKAIHLVRNGELKHDNDHAAAITMMIAKAAASSPDCRDGLIAAALNRNRTEENALAVAALTSALQDARVDRILWPKATKMPADAALIGFLDALQRTPEVLSHMETITIIADGFDKRADEQLAQRTIALVQNRVDPAEVDALICRTMAKFDVTKSALHAPIGLAKRDDQRAALTIAQVWQEQPPHKFARELGHLKSNKTLNDAVLQHLATQLVDRPLQASPWLHALATPSDDAGQK